MSWRVRRWQRKGGWERIDPGSHPNRSAGITREPIAFRLLLGLSSAWQRSSRWWRWERAPRRASSKIEAIGSNLIDGDSGQHHLQRHPAGSPR